MRTILIVALLALAACRSDDAARETPAAVRHEFKWVGYDRRDGVLAIQFNDGSRTNYAGVPEEVYLDLMRAPGKMAFFTNAIQERYEGRAVQ